MNEAAGSLTTATQSIQLQFSLLTNVGQHTTQLPVYPFSTKLAKQLAHAFNISALTATISRNMSNGAKPKAYCNTMYVLVGFISGNRI